jgi:hypothetical protein
MAVDALPSYFAEKGYTCPTDAYDSPFQYAHRTNQHCFEWLAARPRLQKAFNAVMTLARVNEAAPWFEHFPVQTKLAVQSNAEVALVDVGGGVGHDIIALKRRFPEIQGRFVLQDIEPVIQDAKTRGLPEDIEVMAVDFFQTQPVKSAKAYFLRNILHDWPDKQAGVILRNLHDAMGSAGESLLLISESLMPESHVPLYNAKIDLNMMTGFAALERTEKQFVTLLHSCGFEVVKVWKPDSAREGVQALLEAVKKA